MLPRTMFKDNGLYDMEGQARQHRSAQVQRKCRAQDMLQSTAVLKAKEPLGISCPLEFQEPIGRLVPHGRPKAQHDAPPSAGHPRAGSTIFCAEAFVFFVLCVPLSRWIWRSFPSSPGPSRPERSGILHWL